MNLEGFIIVDQSPNAIDISAIRNTNTKIIMRLPEESDRQQAGKSAALKNNQVDALAKLQRGTAVVYQNNWLDPVLCAIEKANVKEEAYKYDWVLKTS
ncbi:MAG: ATP-binding protein, partial [Lachnospiraceae bacterium]|nr:ATP-binding protein [Lachnospiraceae bacterium]